MNRHIYIILARFHRISSVLFLFVNWDFGIFDAWTIDESAAVAVVVSKTMTTIIHDTHNVIIHAINFEYVCVVKQSRFSSQ